MYHPDFTAECRICGTSPCVVVDGHSKPDTELCGQHFFLLPSAVNWEEWEDLSHDDEETDDDE